MRTTLTRSAGGSQVSTYYFRGRFDLPNEPSEVTLTATNFSDDGAVYYINGVEVARFGMGSGTITHTTYANRANEIADHYPEVFTIPASLLHK